MGLKGIIALKTRAKKAYMKLTGGALAEKV